MNGLLGGLLILGALALLASVYFWALALSQEVEDLVKEDKKGVPP